MHFRQTTFGTLFPSQLIPAHALYTAPLTVTPDSYEQQDLIITHRPPDLGTAYRVAQDDHESRSIVLVEGGTTQTGQGALSFAASPPHGLVLGLIGAGFLYSYALSVFEQLTNLVLSQTVIPLIQRSAGISMGLTVFVTDWLCMVPFSNALSQLFGTSHTTLWHQAVFPALLSAFAVCGIAGFSERTSGDSLASKLYQSATGYLSGGLLEGPKAVQRAFQSSAAQSVAFGIDFTMQIALAAIAAQMTGKTDSTISLLGLTLYASILNAHTGVKLSQSLDNQDAMAWRLTLGMAKLSVFFGAATLLPEGLGAPIGELGLPFLLIGLAYFAADRLADLVITEEKLPT